MYLCKCTCSIYIWRNNTKAMLILWWEQYNFYNTGVKNNKWCLIMLFCLTMKSLGQMPDAQPYCITLYISSSVGFPLSSLPKQTFMACLVRSALPLYAQYPVVAVALCESRWIRRCSLAHSNVWGGKWRQHCHKGACNLGRADLSLLWWLHHTWTKNAKLRSVAFEESRLIFRVVGKGCVYSTIVYCFGLR